MDFRDFLDTLYQGWSKTEGAEDRFYIVEEDSDHHCGGPGTWNVWAVGQDESREFVASFDTEHDADWFASLHGAFPDMYRNLLAQSDENDQLDTRNDELTGEIADIAGELADAKTLERMQTAEILDLEQRIALLQADKDLLLDEIRDLENYKYMYEGLE